MYEQVSPGQGESFTFGLSSKGDKVVLLDSERKVADEVDTPDFGDTKGESYARTVDGGGGEWRIAAVPTKGFSNTDGADASLKGVLVINEVYTYADGSEKDDLDFIELYNAGGSDIDLGGLKLWESGGSAEASSSPKAPALRRAASSWWSATRTTRGMPSRKARCIPGWGLSKGPDEYVTLADAEMNEIDCVACPGVKRGESYGRVTDGGAGVADACAALPRNSQRGPCPAARDEYDGTLGERGVHRRPGYRPSSPWNESVDFIEFYNSSDTAIDFGGYVIKDDKGADDESYTVPAGTVIPAGGFLTYDVCKKNAEGPSFGLGKSGDWVFVYDPSGRAGGRVGRYPLLQTMR